MRILVDLFYLVTELQKKAINREVLREKGINNAPNKPGNGGLGCNFLSVIYCKTSDFNIFSFLPEGVISEESN